MWLELWSETRGHLTWRRRDDERDAKEEVKSSEGGGVEAPVRPHWV